MEQIHETPSVTLRRLIDGYQVFAPWLSARPGGRRRRLKAQLVALMDVDAWKILRRDRGLGRAEAEAAILERVSALLGAGR